MIRIHNTSAMFEFEFAMYAVHEQSLISLAGSTPMWLHCNLYFRFQIYNPYQKLL